MAPYRKRRAPKVKARARNPARKRKPDGLGWIRNNPDIASLAAVLVFGIGGAAIYSQSLPGEGRNPASVDLAAAPAEHRHAHGREHAKHLRCNVFLDHGHWDASRPF
jgi:hypothetical protein